ncbi:glycerol-3-phosphate 1-O-acyltransferase PlsY [Candidatus Electrothrix sp.]|uniref:glycerol-3-phosphate 1-O-acyltransferase PlsY n=1 Tax=Candidatus Electrothrix sp. TaxID=2170559 RepID=UPI004055E3DF
MQFSHLFYILLSYFLGAIPFGLLLSRSQGINIREQGSKNIGATNVSRLLGKKLGVVTFLLDCAKGYVPMLLAGLIFADSPNHQLLIALCGAAAVIGHMFPVYLGFKGGKGVATGLGVFLYLAPQAVLLSIIVFIAIVAATGFVSLGSLLGSAVVLPCVYFLDEPTWKLILAGFIVIMIWMKHHENIGRLLQGTEKSFKKRS